MEPAIGSNKETVFDYFANSLKNFNKNEYKIDRNRNTVSYYINSDDGIVEIKLVPIFDNDEVCNNYDVWFIFFNEDGSLHPDNQLFVSRKKLLNQHT